MPLTSRPCSSAAIARIVLMQVPSAVATRSVGENASPLPLLSVGASVAIFACDGPWTASQCRSPVYSMQILTMLEYANAVITAQLRFVAQASCLWGRQASCLTRETAEGNGRDARSPHRQD